MEQPRIFVDLVLVSGQTLTLPTHASQHLVQVLRLRPGDAFALFNGDGRDFSASLLVSSKSAAVAKIEAAGEVEPPPVLSIHLGIGISKGERMDFALQKSVELGVTRITPLFAQRSVVTLSGDRLAKRMRHWQGVVHAACEQSGRRRVPDLSAASTLVAWLGEDHPLPLMLDHLSQTPLPEVSRPDAAVTLLVGPEGGVTQVERVQAISAGFIPVRLGPRVLRTETAPLAALAAIQSLWGDFRA